VRHSLAACIKCGTIAESAGENRDDGTHELKHAGDTTPARHKTLDFSGHSEFLVATGLTLRGATYCAGAVGNGYQPLLSFTIR